MVLIVVNYIAGITEFLKLAFDSTLRSHFPSRKVMTKIDSGPTLHIWWKSNIPQFFHSATTNLIPCSLNCLR